MKDNYSSYATYYANARKRAKKSQDQLTWDDIEAAYDAGLTHGTAVQPAERQKLTTYLRALRVLNAAHHEQEQEQEREQKS